MDSVLYEVAVLTEHTTRTTTQNQPPCVADNTPPQFPVCDPQHEVGAAMYTPLQDGGHCPFPTPVFTPVFHPSDMTYPPPPAHVAFPPPPQPPNYTWLQNVVNAPHHLHNKLQPAPVVLPNFCVPNVYTDLSSNEPDFYTGGSDYYTSAHERGVANGGPVQQSSGLSSAEISVEAPATSQEDSAPSGGGKVGKTGACDASSNYANFMTLLAQKLCSAAAVSKPTNSQAEKLPEVDDIPADELETDAVSEATSDVESEDYFSASSNQLASTGTSRRSSVSSRISRSSSQDDLESESRGSEDNFADVESSEKMAPVFTARRKKQLRMKRSSTALATIFSPAVTAQSMSTPEKPKLPFEKKKKPRDAGGDGYGCADTNGSDVNSDSGATSSSGYHDNMPSGGASDDGSTTETSSVLNPLCSPFVPRAVKEQQQRRLFQERLGSPNSVYHPRHPHIDNEDVNTLEVTYNDSGFANATHLTSDQSSICTSNILDIPTLNESAFCSGSNITFDQLQNHATPFLPFNMVVSGSPAFSPYRTVYPDNANEVIPEVLSPYECRVKHRSDFCRLRDFNTSDLPIAYQNEATFRTITAISHRVVRICVSKYSNIVNTNSQKNVDLNQIFSDKENLDTYKHYGTGFAYFIGDEFIEVRTHMKVVSTADEAEQTQITFSLEDAGRGKYAEVHCKGMKIGYHSNVYSESCIFKCRTPPELLTHLALFEDVPVYRRYSSYQDSAYFSDSSHDSSFDLDHLASTFGPGGALDLTTHDQQPSWSIDSSLAANPGLLVNESHDEGVHETSSCGSSDSRVSSKENPFGYCGIDEKCVKTAFESVGSFHQKDSECHQVWSSVAFSNTLSQLCHLMQPEEVTSPLMIMERRKSEVEPASCPYAESVLFRSVGEYGLFKSFAGDVMEESLPSFQAWPGLSPYSHLSEYGHRWEYEGLVHAQTHHKESYLQAYTTSNTSPPLAAHDDDDDDDGRVVQTETETGNLTALASQASEAVNGLSPDDQPESEERSPSCGELLIEAAKPVEGQEEGVDCGLAGRLADLDIAGYVDTWDKNLLNLDDDLNPLPQESDYLEDLVNKLVSTDDDDISGGQCQCCATSYKSDAHALIVSFPHGGAKAVSTGSFSSHRHVGGELYDTPTCMGSCGAPIIALRQSGGGAYVTQFIHAGTGRVNGVLSGMGVAYFDECRSTTGQLRNICKN